MGNKLKSDEISAAYDTLKNSITKNYGKEVEGTTGFPQIGKVPIKAAQEIKQNLYNLAREYYGFQGPAEAQVQKALGNTMKNAISKAEPGVNLPNFGAQAGYVLPDIAKGLSTVVGFGQPAAAKVINSGINLVPGLVGKAFPLYHNKSYLDFCNLLEWVTRLVNLNNKDLMFRKIAAKTHALIAINPNISFNNI